MFSGDLVLSRNYTLHEMPVFVKSGSIIPMRTDDFGMTVSLCTRNNIIVIMTHFFSISMFTEPLGSAKDIPKSLKLMVFVGDAQV